MGKTFTIDPISHKRLSNLGEFASSTTYWLYDDENDILIGASNLRHYLTEEGLKLWGHIGYGIRPSERKIGEILYDFRFK